MELTIRAATAADAAAITAVLQAAFAQHPHSQNQEYRLVEALRVQGGLSVALCAWQGEQLCGLVCASPVQLPMSAEGWYCIAPLAVLPALQGQGIGQQLMLAVLHKLQAIGAAGCVLVGEPDYYQRFGFSADPALTSAGIPPEYVLSRAFGSQQAQGEIIYHPAFAVLES